MIPKIIHYCWFGGNEKPQDVLNCIASWKKYLPDYEIKEWNESNYDVHKNKYMSDAYKEKKWAFVSDYCRIDVVCQLGGIYFDTDVEVIKSWNNLLNKDFICGFESRDWKFIHRHNMQMQESVALGLGFASCKGHKILKQILEKYDQICFYNTNGSLNLIACPVYQTQVLVDNGLKPDGSTQSFDWGIVYSAEYFCPQSNMTDKMLFLTKNTYSIHHFTNTWNTTSRERLVFKYIRNILGYRLSKIISKLLR